MFIGIFDTAIHLPLPEFIFIIIGILIIGFAAGFLWNNRKGGEEALKIRIKRSTEEADQWRLKYYDLTEANEKTVTALNEKTQEWEAKEEQQAVEIEELTLLNQQLMLKQKNVTAQQTHLVSEIEALKILITQNESALEHLRVENASLKNALADAEEIIKSQSESVADNSIIEALQLQLHEANVKMKEIDIKTQKIEKLYVVGQEEHMIIHEAPIMENVSSWGMQKLREELKRLTQQNTLLESKLNRLSKLEEIHDNQQKK